MIDQSASGAVASPGALGSRVSKPTHSAAQCIDSLVLDVSSGPAVEMEVRVDEALSEVGEMGRYQVRLISMLLVAIAFPGAFVAFAEVFVSATPDHWCAPPAVLRDLPLELIKNLSIPTQVRDGVIRFHQCLTYDLNWTAVDLDQLPKGPDLTWPTKKCDRGWNYDDTYYDVTTVTQFDLVCDSDWWPLLSISLFYAGSLIGSVISGWITDKYGRRNSFFINAVFVVLLPALSAFSPSYPFYVAMRFLVGLTFPAVFQIPFILAMEIIGTRHRTAVAMLASGSWGISTCVLGGVASLVRHWSHLLLVISLPFLLFATYWCFLPESPRWLLAQERYQEAENVLQRIAKVNGRKVDSNLIKKYSSEVEKSVEKSVIVHPGALFKTPNMRKKMLLINLIWVINAIVYIILSYMSAKLGISDYLAFSLFGLVEAPSCLLAWWTMERWGRRSTTLVSMLVVGLLCLANGFVPEDYKVLNVLLPTLGKFFITGTFSIIYVFAGELLPTVARGSGLALLSFISACTLVPSPYIMYLIVYSRVLPLVVLGVMAIVGGVAAIFLPETLGIDLPQSLEEGEAFGKDFRPFLLNRKKSGIPKTQA